MKKYNYTLYGYDRERRRCIKQTIPAPDLDAAWWYFKASLSNPRHVYLVSSKREAAGDE